MYHLDHFIEEHFDLKNCRKGIPPKQAWPFNGEKLAVDQNIIISDGCHPWDSAHLSSCCPFTLLDTFLVWPMKVPKVP